MYSPAEVAGTIGVEEARNWGALILDFFTDAFDGNETVGWVIVGLILVAMTYYTLIRIFGKPKT